MAIRYLDKEFGVNISTAIANDATGRAKVQNLPGAAGVASDFVDFDIKYNRNGTIVALADLSSAQTLTNKTLTSPTITNPTINGTVSGTTTGVVISKTVAFVETVGVTTLTGTVAIPAGSTINNIQVMSTVLWGGTSASLVVGDTGSANGYFTATDLKATDLLVGEVLSTQGGVQTWGGKNGAYLVSATGRMGPTAAGDSGPYYGVADSIIGVVTQGTPSTTGRTFMTVTYSVGTPVATVNT
jgi:hypothetical protein